MTFTTDLPTLVALASAALLAQEPVRMVLPADWARPHNFPCRSSASRPVSRRATARWPSWSGSTPNCAARTRRRRCG